MLMIARVGARGGGGRGGAYALAGSGSPSVARRRKMIHMRVPDNRSGSAPFCPGAGDFPDPGRGIKAAGERPQVGSPNVLALLTLDATWCTFSHRPSTYANSKAIFRTFHHLL